MPHALPGTSSILGVAPNSFDPKSDSHNMSFRSMGLAKQSSQLAIAEPAEKTDERVLDCLPKKDKHNTTIDSTYRGRTWHCSCRGCIANRRRCRTVSRMRLVLYILGGGTSLVLCTCGIRGCLSLFGRRHREREWWRCSKHLQTLLTGLTAVETIAKNLALFRVPSVKRQAIVSTVPKHIKLARRLMRHTQAPVHTCNTWLQ